MKLEMSPSTASIRLMPVVASSTFASVRTWATITPARLTPRWRRGSAGEDYDRPFAIARSGGCGRSDGAGGRRSPATTAKARSRTPSSATVDHRRPAPCSASESHGSGGDHRLQRSEPDVRAGPTGLGRGLRLRWREWGELRPIPIDAPTCARPSLEEGKDEHLKLLLESRGDITRPAKARSPAGSESCVATGRPVLRSVDSECVGRVTEPREHEIPARADGVLVPEGYPRAPQCLGAAGLAGVLRAGHAHKDSPGTWEASTSPRKGTVRGPEEIRAGRDASLLVCIAKRRNVVPPSEGIRSAAGWMPRNRSEP